MTTDRFRKRLLGISLGERALLVAEIACAKDGHRILHLAEFAYPPGVTLEQPQALGEALGAFLRQQQISARRAILGVPARWLLLKNHSLPPVEPQAASAMLWLRAESENVPELGEMIFDYSGQTSPLTPSSVLLMGLPRRWLDRLATLARGAGLTTLAITPTAAALVAATSTAMGNPHILLLSAEGAELATHVGGQLKFLRHLGSGTSLSSSLIELRRAAATHLLEVPSTLILWDEIDLDDSAQQAITTAVNLPVQRGNLSSLAHSANPTQHPEKRFGAAAVALATGGTRPAINFLHPRVVAPKKTSVSRRTSWITAAAAVLAIAALLAFVDISRLQRRLDADESQLKTLEPTLKTARPFVQNMQFVETFESSHPKYLACLRDITNATPPDGQTYLTNFHLQSNMRGDFSGRSSNSQEILNLMDKLNTSKHFLDLKRKLDAGGRTADVSFSVTFTYSPH